MISYKLLTPGPLTTTDTVKQEMLVDHCTWDDDYKTITQSIRTGLLSLAHVSADQYTTVLMQGSGTFGVESVLCSTIGPNHKLLIATNGAYGERMVQMASCMGLNFVQYAQSYDAAPDAEVIARLLDEDKTITHVAMVHCETTSGILNDIQSAGQVCKDRNKTFLVDAMSSFGGIEIPVADWGIDFLISSANKCIQGVPGFSFVIANKEKLAASKGISKSLSLDLYDQWAGMDQDGKWRFTSPTHVVLAFAKAMKELEAEGGIPARQERYTKNNRLLIEKMAELGFAAYIKPELQSPIITTFIYPQGKFDFSRMYQFIKARGYAIYPGKLTEMDTFRIGNIGEIYPEDIEKLCGVIKEYREAENQ